MSIHLILGGARSGKSSFAEQKAKQFAAFGASQRHYVATAIAFDDEMQQRILHHQAQRGDAWCEHEAPIALAATLAQFTRRDVVLVDCLTLWLNNVIYNHGETLDAQAIEARVTALTDALVETQATVLLVSNEVGLGVVPMGEVSRLFVDHAGWMNQAIARHADSVTLIAAGLPLALKGNL
ncbi:bifunctional adenosylcobinamide kinase/adenosylcobinamide-phosphate guanylyltransferase [Vibrio sp. Vb2880]|uniref:bifunctional adenosylcobinamide kinase/adenosylcobinamide-phosphate guanylyltransferase n=1 Tax=Vibrio sp. Vb2880 TaxID=2816076 RepID=UPI001A8F8DA3|nr:bifunctional adenosylcobinamide kinase/adenosylcobinamide-phosphate guanylyltransferase [Vibrio sp. Vb2880]MBO0215336.1 bifunctional adenosylcobinamide kinase/adenosylcobinamide-phosphate guanylyltransferase [Vibrio sp. Vb2880]